MDQKDWKIVVGSENGLCNRLKVIVSGMAFAKKSGRALECWWPRKPACNCSFEDLFSNDLNVKNVSSEEFKSPKWIAFSHNDPLYDPNNFPFDPLSSKESVLYLKGVNFFTNPPKFPAHKELQQMERHFFETLTPKNSLLDQINSFAEKNFVTKMLGMHIRRGDFFKYCPGKIVPTQSYFTYADDFLKRNPSGKIFLSTDDGAPFPYCAHSIPSKNYENIKKQFIKKYGEKVIFTSPRSINRNDKEAIEDALIDLYLLRKTDEFVGTKASSFSGVAVFNRKVNKISFPSNDALDVLVLKK